MILYIILHTSHYVCIPSLLLVLVCLLLSLSYILSNLFIISLSSLYLSLLFLVFLLSLSYFLSLLSLFSLSLVLCLSNFSYFHSFSSLSLNSIISPLSPFLFPFLSRSFYFLLP